MRKLRTSAMELMRGTYRVVEGRVQFVRSVGILRLGFRSRTQSAPQKFRGGGVVYAYGIQ